MDEDDETCHEESIRSQLLNKRFLIPAIIFVLFSLYIKSAENMFDKVTAAEHDRQVPSHHNAWSMDPPAQPAR